MSFREAFTKSKEQLLDYDDSASLYFGATLLLLTIIPLSLYLISRIKSSLTGGSLAVPSDRGCCKCSLCAQVFNAKRKESRDYLKSFYFINQFILLLVLVAIFVRVVVALSTVSEIQAFNPFNVLNIVEGASERTIRKAYRTLSLRHHPDKNPNDPSAAAKFMMIAKAYQSLTDETARANYKKYGNPDGPGVMKIGIGLPHFLIDENNQGLILAFFLVVLIFSIPFVFLLYYHRIKLYNSSGVRVDTVHFYSFYLSEQARFHYIAECLAASAESQEQNYSPDDCAELEPLVSRIRNLRKPKFTVPIIKRNYILIIAHLQRLHDSIPVRLKKDLEALLRVSPKITQSMIEIASVHNWLHVVRNVVEFRRSLIQALCPELMTSLYQLPHFTADLAKQFDRQNPPIRTLQQFIDADAEVKPKLLTGWTEQQQMDVTAFCSHIPRLQVEIEASVAGESEIVAGDVVTVAVTLLRQNLKRDNLAGPVHAPKFPDAKFEEYWLFLVNRRTEGLQAYARVRSREREVMEEMKFMISSPGFFTFQLIVMSDSYDGVDITKDVEIKVLPSDAAKRSIFVHPIDEALDTRPSFMQAWQQGNDEDDKSDDD